MHQSDRLIELILKVSRLLKDKMVFVGPTAHLTMLQIQALLFIKKRKNAQMREIADQFRVKMSTATSLLDKLVAIKLVKRVSDDKDRRIVRISLTKKGNTLIESVTEQRRKKINAVLSYLSTEDKKALFRILQTIQTKTE